MFTLLIFKQVEKRERESGAKETTTQWLGNPTLNTFAQRLDACCGGEHLGVRGAIPFDPAGASY
jgi:hypothetical protein